MKRALPLFVFSLLILTACAQPNEGDSMEMEDKEPAMEEKMEKEMEKEDEGNVPKQAKKNVRGDAPAMEEAMMEDESDSDVAAEASTEYAVYSDEVIGNGKESVLFFHASWCPKCKANDGKLTSWYNSQEFGRSIYKIEFDDAGDLREKYGVTSQDTFILIDGDGNEISRAQFPSESALRDLLG